MNVLLNSVILSSVIVSFDVRARHVCLFRQHTDQCRNRPHCRTGHTACSDERAYDSVRTRGFFINSVFWGSILSLRAYIM
ncbi:hypothetical protein T492DRAFT_974325 [Pavlovales sp. CCMP2436]|nr:hypothetical protein T492DRAFT_974325 [Pavlovales sp. CCMP2436]